MLVFCFKNIDTKIKKYHTRNVAKPKIRNDQLPAGALMYFYCISCNDLSDTLSENYTSTPKKICEECKALKELGWLE